MKGQHRKTLESAIVEVVALLADDAVLGAKFVDNALTGQWADHRDCHVKPDLYSLVLSKSALAKPSFSSA